MRLRRSQNRAIPISSSRVSTVPTGFQGVFRIRTRAAGDHGGFQSLVRDDESSLFDSSGYRFHPSARQSNRRLIGIIDRIGQQNFVALVKQRRQRRIDPERAAAGREHFRRGIEIELIVALQLSRDRFAKRLLSAIVGISRAPVAQRARARFDDVRRRGQVGLAAH